MDTRKPRILDKAYADYMDKLGPCVIRSRKTGKYYRGARYWPYSVTPANVTAFFPWRWLWHFECRWRGKLARRKRERIYDHEFVPVVALKTPPADPETEGPLWKQFWLEIQNRIPAVSKNRSRP